MEELGYNNFMLIVGHHFADNVKHKIKLGGNNNV